MIYCTYFDKGFLLKGLALHASLIRNNPDTKLWILTFDYYTEKVLRQMKLKGTTIVSLTDFEDKELLAVKPTRHLVEYFWTCTPSFILYVMNKNPLCSHVVYLDADLYFYSDVNVKNFEIESKSILAVEHRFPKGEENKAENSGRFNVAFNIFKNNKVGQKCLKRWRNQCLDWCYWEYQDGKLGDQMYLDEWPKLYRSDLVISKNVGLDAAPWNISQYKISNKKGITYIDSDKLVCYHFHQFQILGPNHFSRVMGYTLSKNIVKYIYEPYEAELRRQYEKVLRFDKNFKIEITEKDKNETFMQKVTRRFGPVYLRFKNLVKWPKS